MIIKVFTFTDDEDHFCSAINTDTATTAENLLFISGVIELLQKDNFPEGNRREVFRKLLNSTNLQ
jgi:hypothetical protein